MEAGERRLAAVRDGIAQLEPKLGGIAIELWDGSTIPPAPAKEDLRITLGDEATVAALMKRPSFDTIVRLYALSRLEIEGGNFFGLAQRGPIAKPRELLAAVGPTRLARVAALYLRVAPGMLQLPGEEDGADGENALVNPSDLSSRFYELFLDPGMVFSCAYFPTWEADLAAAQKAKLDLVCRKLRLRKGDRLLDIGCGWGALVCHAAEHYGVEAHGVTPSREQHAYAEERIRRAGLSARACVALEDWTQLEGEYDKIASIGMFEHVPLARHDDYFDRVRSLLGPRGLYLHHAMARRGKASESGDRRPEYQALLRHIFPGAEVDHLGSTLSGLESAGFEIHDVEGLREHYAKTTEIWSRRLMAARAAAAAEVGEARTRLWTAYLAGLSLAFRRGSIGVFQTLVSVRGKGAAPVPSTRADLYS